MRVLVLTDALHSDAPGGSRRVVKELTEGLIRCECQVTVVAPRWKDDDAAHSEENGVVIRRYGRGRQGLRGAPRLVGAGRHLLLEMQRASPGFDIMHVHFAYAHLPALLLPTMPVEPITIRTFYGPWALEGAVEEGPQRANALGSAVRTRMRFVARSSVERRSLAQSQRIIALSTYSSKQLTELYDVSPEKITHIPGGVDHRRFVPLNGSKVDLRRRLGLPDTGPVLLTVRRLAARMGLDSLIAAMPMVLNALTEKPHLVIVGQGHLRPQLERQVQSLGLKPWVHFTGFVPDADLPAYYQAADVFVLPTRSLEGFGLITLEALSTGIPVLGTPAGATPELLAQVDPRLTFHGVTSDAMATGIVGYFTHLHGLMHPRVLRELILAKYTWESVVSQTRDVYRDALSSRQMV